MGQIVRLPISPTAFPDASARLSTAECVALLAIRWWVTAFRRDQDPLPRVAQGLGRAGAGGAAPALDFLMAVVARSARQPIAIHAPRCPTVSPDEKHLLHATALAQSGPTASAEAALRTALLSAEGAAFAVGSLDVIATLFAAARLFFPRRTAPSRLGSAAQPNATGAWPLGPTRGTIH